MENEKVSSSSKLTEFLKQSFYFVGILSIVIMLNFNFRPSNTIQYSSNSTVSKDSGSTIVYQYISADYYNTLGLIIMSIVFLLIFCGAIYSFMYAIKSSKVETKN